MSLSLTEPAKFLLLVALLSKDHIISNDGKSFLKELILRRDTRLTPLIKKFEEKESIGDVTFLEQIHDLICDEAKSVFDELFVDTSLEVGKTLSKTEREQKNLSDEKSLIYGEVEFLSFYRVLRKINPAPGTVFYDLGSGTGKALFVARMTQDFAKCIGIEILHGLHEQAVEIVDKFNKSVKDVLALGQQHYVNVYEGSFLDFDWSNGDVVFANSTCFSDELMADLSKQAEKLKPGSIVVTFTKGMTSRAFEVLERKRYRMSWGPATVFIHRRLGHDMKPVGPARLNILPSDSITYDDEVEQQNQQTYGSHGQQFDRGNDNHQYDDDIDENIQSFQDDGDDEDDEENDDEDDEDNGDDEDDEDDNNDDNDDDNDEDEDSDEENDDDDEDNIDDIVQDIINKSKQQASPMRATKAGSNPFLSSPIKLTHQQSSNGGSLTPLPEPPRSLDSASEFSMLNSPLDSALLMRKRNANNKQTMPPVPPDDDAALFASSPMPVRNQH